MMKYQEPEMDIIELEIVDTTAASLNGEIWNDSDMDIGGGANEGGVMPVD